jgi:hypothetical protein
MIRTVLCDFSCGESHRLDRLKGFFWIQQEAEKSANVCGGWMTQEDQESSIGVSVAPEITNDQSLSLSIDPIPPPVPIVTSRSARSTRRRPAWPKSPSVLADCDSSIGDSFSVNCQELLTDPFLDPLGYPLKSTSQQVPKLYSK